MSQDWTDDVYDKDAYPAHTIMSNIELMFATLKSTFSGAGNPSNTVAGMPWFDTTKKLQKYRDSTNTIWRGILAGTASLKLWLYLNAAEEGWAIDATVTDRVIALKGGSQAYNINGGVQGGSWTPNHVHAGGGHTLVEAEMPSHVHDERGSDGQRVYAQGAGETNNEMGAPGTDSASVIATYPTGGGGSHNHGNTATAVGSTHRPYAAVGTLQYPDV